ncbi:hypothetical protein EZJ43_04775 [Pedobacter changchengzhani]|uniref:SbsA Ig-like domain-containing protein n=1 Tax=Pedobacter changchengzhani TaxID=2529274 RepID=A0A4V6PJA0_9SPHI|nr:Ig-like domain-containing protein [Pedobacter changchengzhani]TDG37433.1 hypothetical protein EZJ43_04775 [Pedobacter changchengzhani]
MANFKSYYFRYINYVSICIILCSLGCASIQSPQGGPRDTTAPKIISMTPKNLSVNFKAKKILIEFDEYFKLSNEFKEFTISPDQEKPPVLKVRQKKLEITIQDSLEKNTTYTMNFGKAIIDVNEGNIVKNLSYVFSTGPELDSLSISGNVSNSSTGEYEKDITVFILPLERDSLFGKKRASIYTLTDSAGHYQINNLRKGKYKIYALKEVNGGDKIYQQLSDEIGFIKKPLVLEKSVDNINLEIFKELAPEFRIKDKKLLDDGSILLTFNQQLKNPSITISDFKNLDENKKVSFSKNNDSAHVYLDDLSFDSIKVNVLDQGKILQTTSFSREKKDTYKRVITITDNLTSGKLSPYKTLTLSLPLPITAVDPSKVILLEDSVRRTNFEMIKDSVNFLKYYLKYPWKQKKDYNIKFGEGTFTTIFDAKNKDFTIVLKLESTDNFGTITMNAEVPDTTKSYIVELMNEKKEVLKSTAITKNTPIKYVNYPAGKYAIRVIYDENKNKIWDTGNVALGLQPEKIWYLPADVDLKANWEREDKLIIPLTPLPVQPKPTTPRTQPNNINNNNNNNNNAPNTIGNPPNGLRNAPDRMSQPPRRSNN